MNANQIKSSCHWATIEEKKREKRCRFSINIPGARTINVNIPKTPRLSLEKLVPRYLIGTGSFSEVVLAVDESALKRRREGVPVELSEVVALKILRKSKEKRKMIDVSTKTELRVFQILKRYPFPFVARLITHFETHDRVCIGLEFYPGGDLRKLLSDGIFRENSARIYAAEISLALAHLHGRNIIYNDLKPENIAIAADGHIRLIDFGSSIILDDVKDFDFDAKRVQVVSSSGTVGYAAPEIFFREPHAFESDWWSLGLIVLEMISGSLLWYDDDVSVHCNNICNKEANLDELGISMEEETRSWIAGTLQKEGCNRLGYNSSNEILEHEFFDRLDFAVLSSANLMLDCVRPPIVPILSDALDVSNFDSQFTRSKIDMPPLRKWALAK